MSQITLGIETSGMSGRVALRVDGRNLEERELSTAGRRHAQTLIFEIRGLLEAHHVNPREIGLLAASQGPGSFTGLRVGVVAAKTLAWVNGGKLAMVDTLQAIAAESPDGVTSVEVVSDAQRDELFLGSFVLQDLVWRSTKDIRIVRADDWASSLVEKNSETFAVTGPGLKKAADFLPDSVRILKRAAVEPSAMTIARLGEQLAKEGQLADPMTAEPFYLRMSAAEEKRDAVRAATE